MAALSSSCSALLYFGEDTHSQVYPVENSSVLWLKLPPRLLTGNVSGGEIPDQNKMTIFTLVTEHWELI